MLRQRLLTSGIAGVCVIAGTLLAPAWAIITFLVVAIGVAGLEWSRLAGMTSALERGVHASVTALLVLVVGGVTPGFEGIALTWIGVAAVGWLVVTLWLLLGALPRSGTSGRRWGWLLLGLVFLPALGGGLAWMVATAELSRGIVLFALGLVWAADSGAYFVGRAIGRNRLAPGISAGKTWEGAAGGLGVVAVYAAIGALVLGVPAVQIPLWMALAVAAAGVSIVGDLFESVLKREAGVKDSGALLPGHGGLLDRVDSMMAAVPVMAIGLAWLTGAGT